MISSRWGNDLGVCGELAADFSSPSGRLHSLIYISIPCFPLGNISPARQLLAQHVQVALMVSFS